MTDRWSDRLVSADPDLGHGGQGRGELVRGVELAGDPGGQLAGHAWPSVALVGQHDHSVVVTVTDRSACKEYKDRLVFNKTRQDRTGQDRTR